jgi:hypothetical protein
MIVSKKRLDRIHTATAHARLVRELLSLPAVPDQHVHKVLGIPDSSYRALLAAGRGPRRFSIGRRKFARPQDLLAYLEEQAAGPGGGTK